MQSYRLNRGSEPDLACYQLIAAGLRAQTHSKAPCRIRVHTHMKSRNVHDSRSQRRAAGVSDRTNDRDLHGVLSMEACSSDAEHEQEGCEVA